MHAGAGAVRPMLLRPRIDAFPCFMDGSPLDEMLDHEDRIYNRSRVPSPCHLLLIKAHSRDLYLCRSCCSSCRHDHRAWKQSGGCCLYLKPQKVQSVLNETDGTTYGSGTMSLTFADADNQDSSPVSSPTLGRQMATRRLRRGRTWSRIEMCACWDAGDARRSDGWSDGPSGMRRGWP